MSTPYPEERNILNLWRHRDTEKNLNHQALLNFSQLPTIRSEPLCSIILHDCLYFIESKPKNTGFFPVSLDLHLFGSFV
jgi:hypothetical protein